MIIKRYFRWFLYLMAMIGITFTGLAAYTNVSTRVDAVDRSVFLTLGFKKSTQVLSFDQEIELIRAVQMEVFRRAPFGEGIPDYSPREPINLFKAARGMCYDRSRTFDKIFQYLGFETRHVYLLYKEGKSFPVAMLQYGQPSHAVTEVLTSRGWLFIESNTPWLAITRKGDPVDADHVWQRIDEFNQPPEYLAHPWWAIRGMYSRKGQFYAPHIPFPEFNWFDFVSWLLKG